jgi:hypothetical protein
LASFCARVGEPAVVALASASATPNAKKQASAAVIASVERLRPIANRCVSLFMVTSLFDCM